jgi:transcriptional regulator of NAD metabolism
MAGEKHQHPIVFFIVELHAPEEAERLLTLLNKRSPGNLSSLSDRPKPVN